MTELESTAQALIAAGKVIWAAAATPGDPNLFLHANPSHFRREFYLPPMIHERPQRRKMASPYHARISFPLETVS
jgi:hypothetical protein